MAVERLEHVGVVVEDLEAAIAFFVELGLELDGSTQVEGEWVGRVIGLQQVNVDIAILRTPDGQGKLELAKFNSPASPAGDPDAASNVPGLRHVLFAVDDIDDTVERLRGHGGELVGEIQQYEDMYRLCYLRGPAGIIVELAEKLG